MDQSAGVGPSLGLPGVLLALAGIVFARRHWGWVLLGAGLFMGNLIFCLWHHPFDNLTFTIPGLAGLALLAGLGVAGPYAAAWRTPGRWLCRGPGLATVLFLLLTNYPLVDRATPATAADLALARRLAAAPFPQNSGVPTFLLLNAPPDLRALLLPVTPPVFAERGLLWMNPPPTSRTVRPP